MEMNDYTTSVNGLHNHPKWSEREEKRIRTNVQYSIDDYDMWESGFVRYLIGFAAEKNKMLQAFESNLNMAGWIQATEMTKWFANMWFSTNWGIEILQSLNRIAADAINNDEWEWE